MNKKILPIIISSFLLGCASNHEIEKQEEDSVKNETQELFYNAFVGNIMEQSGQNNNAIKYYENILSKQYEESYFNKLFSLYSYKNDTISLINLIKNTDYEKIKENHSNLLIIHQIENDNYENAVTEMNYLLSTKQNETENKTKIEIETIKEQLQYLSVFYGINSKEVDSFFIEMKKNDLSLFNLSYVFLGKEEELEKENNMLFLSDYELSIYIIKKYYENDNFENLNKILNDKLISINEKNTISNSYFSKLFEEKEYSKIKKEIDLLKNKNKYETKNQKIIEFLSYYDTFDNSNALYLLDKNRDSFEDDFYFLHKGKLNYRLGYKNAAYRYFNNINDEDIKKSDIYLYIDLYGVEVIDKFENLNDIQKETLKFGYYIKKRNQNKSKDILSNIEEVINETGNQLEDSEVLNDISYLYNKIYDKNLMVIKAKQNYEDNKDIMSANTYLYSLIITDSDLDIMTSIYEEYKDSFEENNAYVDTKAMYLFKKGKPNEALGLYKKYKMLYSNDLEIQQNISTIYKDLGKIKDSKKHKEYIKSIKLK